MSKKLLKTLPVSSSADERSRTSTLLRAQPPQGCVYAISPHPLVQRIAYSLWRVVKNYTRKYPVLAIRHLLRPICRECPRGESNSHAIAGTSS